jgi:hypothetical protein
MSRALPPIAAKRRNFHEGAALYDQAIAGMAPFLKRTHGLA